MFASAVTRTILRASFFSNFQIPKTINVVPVIPHRRAFSICSVAQCKEASDKTETVEDISKDRTKVIPVETSIRYLKSSAYAQTYGTDPVWKLYRRNHKGPLAPKRTRKTCIRSGKLATGNPCPICRDEYLVLKPENVELLKQFISPYTGETYGAFTTGICQKRQKELIVAVELAKDRGLIEFDVPFREYDYSMYKEN